MSIEKNIRNFINQNFFVAADEASLPAEASLTQGGTVDSMGVLELIMFVEESYGFRIPDSETVPENLDTISRLVRYISDRARVPAAA